MSVFVYFCLFRLFFFHFLYFCGDISVCGYRRIVILSTLYIYQLLLEFISSLIKFNFSITDLEVDFDF